MAQHFESEKKQIDSAHVNDPFYQECSMYVNLEPTERLLYLKSRTEATTFMLAETDVISLSNLDSLPRFGFDIDHDSWEVRLDTAKFKAAIQIVADSFKSKSFLSNAKDTFLAPLYGFEVNNYANNDYLFEFLDSYFLNRPSKRIMFLQRYKHEIPTSFLKLIKHDLDTIYNVTTYPILMRGGLDEGSLNESIEIWTRAQTR